MQVTIETAKKRMKKRKYEEAATILCTVLEKARQPFLLVLPDFRKIIARALCMRAECFLEMVMFYLLVFSN